MQQKHLTIEEIRERFPDEWVLLVDYEQDDSFAPTGGKVAAHSPRRGDVYRKLPDLKNRRTFVLPTGDIPEDTGVLFLWG
mgnify:CR=1 FL=1